MKDKGWIKLYRQIQDNALWNDGEPYDKAHAWIDLLLCVNHANRKKIIGNEIVTVKRGSMFTSDNFLANRWHWSRERVRRFLALIERDNMVTLKRTSYGTWINVVNYAHFQGGRTTNETSNETTVETTNEAADETQYKNDKNDNNANNFLCAAALKKIPPTRSDVEEYCRQKNYHIDLIEFFSYYDLHDWTLGNGRKITNWTAAVDYWYQNGKKMNAADTKPMPYFEEFKTAAPLTGEASPFKNGLASEMIRRKREKKVNE